MRDMLRLGGAASAVITEAGRFGIDRLRRPGPMPDTASRVTSAWSAPRLGLPAGDLDEIIMTDEHHGTATRARLALLYRRGASGPATVFLKLPPCSAGGRPFMNVMGLGERETMMYRKVLRELGALAPRAYAAEWDAHRGRGVLVLEDLEARGCRLADITQPCSVDDACRVLASLARIHGRFWDSARFRTDLAPLAGGVQPRVTPLMARLTEKVVHRPTEGVPDDVSAYKRQGYGHPTRKPFDWRSLG